MQLWAFGTSPYGLGLDPDAFWRLTIREYRALKAVHDANLNRWAFTQSMFANAHFRKPEEPSFEPQHFLGKKRETAAVASPEVTTVVLDFALGTGQVPDWALRPSLRRS